MRSLPLTTVPRWQSLNGRWVPVAVDTNCPHCNRAVSLELGNHYFDPPRDTVSASARCAGCGRLVRIWVLEPSTGNEGHAAEIAIHPSNQDNHQPIEGHELLPETLRRAYLDVVRVYNTRVWSATTTLCRRTLEGTVMHLMGVQNVGGKTLNEMLRELPTKINLGEPITRLANSVRLGGNIGAHFDLEAEPDEELAGSMLALLEYLLEYCFTIPQLIAKAQKALERHANQERS